MNTVIVLDAPNRPRKAQQDAGEQSQRTFEFADSTDPDELKKIVRRQAALASAQSRKDTIAALRSKRGKRTDGTYRNVPRKPSSSTESTSSSSQNEVVVKQKPRPSPTVLEVGRRQMDPFSILPIDFNAIKDPNMLHSLFGYCVEVVAPLMDMRMPIKPELTGGVAFTWKVGLPNTALRSPPSFWALVMGASCALARMQRKHPTDTPITMTLRQKAIECVNEELRSMKDSNPDLGLLGAIALLGAYERMWGTREAWKAHQEGMKTLSAFLADGGGDNEIAVSILAFSQDDQSRIEELPELEARPDGSGIGFVKMREATHLNFLLAKSIMNCSKIDTTTDSSKKTEMIGEAAAVIMKYSPGVSMTDVMCADSGRDQEGDERNMQMHYILQSAGASMLHFLSNGEGQSTGLAMIDIPVMCKEAVKFAKNVVKVPMYDEPLVWGIVTICALNRLVADEGLEAIAAAVHRLQMGSLPFTDWERLLRKFAYVESARSLYRQLWYFVMLLRDRQSAQSSEQEDFDDYTCATQ